MRSNRIPLRRMTDSTDHWAANARIRMTPRDRNRVDTKGISVGRQRNVIRFSEFWFWNTIAI
jgi:hypothetical protein